MKNYLLYICLPFFSISCKKSGDTNSQHTSPGVTVYAPVPVVRTVSKRIFVHLMPWFENKVTNNGVWGIHWKMNTQNPDVLNSNGERQIASHFYPLIGPYASGDAAVIEYQLLLMKLSGIDGVFIDWPGTQNLNDYPQMVTNTEKVVAQLSKVGLNFAIVYEDQNTKNLSSSDKVSIAQRDMAYLQSTFFNLPNYEKLANKPLLLDFGPQSITSEADWTSVFSGLNTKPSFFPLWFQSGKAGMNATGEFAWIPQDNLTTLNNFYNNSYNGIKLASAYPGFYSFYAEGGWAGPTWTIAHNGVSTFSQTLDLALAQKNIDYIQIPTWNDYGEGTMIEPTTEFGYSFLTVLQQKLGVSAIGQSDLEMVAKLYQLRKDKAEDADVQKKLDQVFYDLVSLRLADGKKILEKL